MMRNFLITFCFFGLMMNSWGQDEVPNPPKHGSIQLNFGTTHVYRTVDLGYETPTLFNINERHHFRVSLDGGIWQARLFNTNIGGRFGLDLVYLFGKERHFLEMNAGMGFHLDKGLKGLPLNYIGTLPAGYLGYRYESLANRFIFKAGFGWYEFLQLGVGYRF